MKIPNISMPIIKQKELLNQPGPDGPVFMINLVKFKDKAVYGDNRETNLSGREAYRLYGQEVTKMLPKYNAEVVFGARINQLIIGEKDELWEEIAVVKYVSKKDLNHMTTSQEWNAVNVHRLAG